MKAWLVSLALVGRFRDWARLRRASDRLSALGSLFFAGPKKSNQKKWPAKPGEGKELGATSPCRVSLLLLEELQPLCRGRSGA